MVTSLVTFQPFAISASSSSNGSRKSATQGRKTTSSQSQPSSTGWLSPIFGWSTDQPGYIDSRRSPSEINSGGGGGGDAAESDEERPKARGRGNFTEEKARQLRMMTTGLEMSHEKMYHSAIASRLASDFSDRFLDDLI